MVCCLAFFFFLRVHEIVQLTNAVLSFQLFIISSCAITAIMMHFNGDPRNLQ